MDSSTEVGCVDVFGLATASNVQTLEGRKRDLISEEVPFDPLRFSDLVLSLFTGQQSEQRSI